MGCGLWAVGYGLWDGMENGIDIEKRVDPM